MRESIKEACEDGMKIGRDEPFRHEPASPEDMAIYQSIADNYSKTDRLRDAVAAWKSGVTDATTAMVAICAELDKP